MKTWCQLIIPATLLFASMPAVADSGLLPPAPLNLLSEDGWPPFTFEEQNIAKGFAVDVAQEIQTLLKETQPIQPVPWTRGFRLSQQQPNVVLFTVIRNKEREKMFTLLGPIGHCELALYGLEKNQFKIQSLSDAKKVVAIAATKDSLFSSTLEDAGLTNILYTTSPTQEARLLQAGRVDLIMGDPRVIQDAFNKVGLGHLKLKKYYSAGQHEVYIAFSKGTPKETINRWKEALAALKKNGKFQQLSQQWLLDSKISPKVEVVGLKPDSSHNKKTPALQ